MLYIHSKPSKERKRLEAAFRAAESGESLDMGNVKRLIDALTTEKNFNVDVLALVKTLPEKERFETYLHFIATAGLRPRSLHSPDDATVTAIPFDEFMENVSPFINMLKPQEHYDAWVKVWHEYTKKQHHEDPELSDTTNLFLKEILNSIGGLEHENRYDMTAGLLNEIHDLKDGSNKFGLEEITYTMALQYITAEEPQDTYERSVDIYHDLGTYHTLRPQDDREQFKKTEGRFLILRLKALEKAVEAIKKMDPAQHFERLMTVYKKTQRQFLDVDKYFVDKDLESDDRDPKVRFIVSVSKFSRNIFIEATRSINALPESLQKGAALQIYEQPDGYSTLEEYRPEWAKRLKEMVSERWQEAKPELGIEVARPEPFTPQND